MKAILIDPAERSLEWIDIPEGTRESLIKIREIVGDYLDFAYVRPGESIAVGDKSALQDPPLPRYRISGYKWPIYGRGVVLGYDGHGNERETRLTVEELSEMIEFE
jgi:hypothetical protein